MLDEITYNIDFSILESDDPKTITLLDLSTYTEVPEKPLVEVILPGFTGHVEAPYVIGGLTILNSDVLKLTDPCEYEEYADLPDGIYGIKYKVCPYDELFKQKYYLKICALIDCLDKIYTQDISNFDQKTKNDLIDIDIMISSIKSELKYSNIEKASGKYQQLTKKVNYLLKRLNCQ